MSKSIKPLSTISYNSPRFLKAKLDQLIKDGVLDFYCYILHHGESLDDGSVEKDHYHVYLVPGEALDKRQLRQYFIEFYKKEKLPRGFMPMQNSSWTDWYLYGLHDKEYLDAKGQKRDYHYTDKDMQRSDDTFYWDQVHRIDRTKINPLGAVIQAAQTGMTFQEFVTSCPLSLLQVRSAQFIFEQVQGKGTTLKNAGRQDHEPIDPETGEYVSPVFIPD